VWFGSGGEVTSKLENFVGDKMQFRLSFASGQKRSIEISLPLIGKQFVLNALAASAVAKVFEVDFKKIKDGLNNFTPPEHRMKAVRTIHGATILDDSYNNNPNAALKAIDTLYEYAGSKQKVVIVFGDMLELGKLEKEHHRNIGKYLGRKLRFEKLICVGKLSRYTAKETEKLAGKDKVSHYISWQEALDGVKRLLTKNTVVLIKGSRSIGLDNLVDKLSK
jgi:UDP-N-acetylmuramoyl-tripeptide--D-alanyl-D-alanine ligase